MFISVSSEPHLDLPFGIFAVEHTHSQQPLLMHHKNMERNTNCKMPKAFSELSQIHFHLYYIYLFLSQPEKPEQWTIKNIAHNGNTEIKAKR